MLYSVRNSCSLFLTLTHSTGTASPFENFPFCVCMQTYLLAGHAHIRPEEMTLNNGTCVTIK